MSKYLIFLLLLPIAVQSHPGRTDKDGCHYCRTNCDKWGVPWDVKHCHFKSEPDLKIPVKEENEKVKKLNQS